MDNLSPEQKKNLETWAILRDKALREISDATIEKERLQNVNIGLAVSNTEIQNNINKGEGRLEEIEKKEKERIGLVSVELSNLEIEKSTAQVSLASLKEDIVILLSKKYTIIDLITTLTAVHEKVFDRTGGLEAIVDHVTRVSSENIAEVKNLLEVVEKSTTSIVEINQKNVKETMILIDKLPRAILEYRRPVLPSRTFVSKKSILENNQEPK